MDLGTVRIVLVEPAGPRNLGSIARVLKNMGLSRWVLVNPHCDPQDPEAQIMAVHGADLLAQVQIVTSLSEALQGCQRVVGTTGRDQTYPPEWQIESPRSALPWVLGAESAAVVFGPEDRGLSNGELSLCQRQVMIPASPEYPSLNLAQAVGICGYELRLAALVGIQTTGDPIDPIGEDHPSQPHPNPVPVEIMEGFYGHLRELLLGIGYLQPHTADRKLSKFRALFNRAGLTRSEVALLRGILRQLGWAVTHAPASSSETPRSRSIPPKGDLER